MSTNTPNENTDKQLAPRQPREVRVVEDTGPLSYLFDTSRFEHMFRIAGAMAAASLIPEHLWRNKTETFAPDVIKANCFLIVNQSIRWGMDPFAVMPETYVVGGKLGYQGKLVTAVINARAGLKERLRFTHSGTKGTDGYTVTVSGQFPDESEPRTITLSVGEAKTDNKMWTKDPEQKLCYSGAVKWARRHAPEVILGILTDDDLERIEASTQVRESTGARSIDTFVMPTRKVDAPVGEQGTVIEGQAPKEEKASKVSEEHPAESIKRDLITGIMKAKNIAGVEEKYLIQAIVQSFTDVDPATVKTLDHLNVDVLDSVRDDIENLISEALKIKGKAKK